MLTCYSIGTVEPFIPSMLTTEIVTIHAPSGNVAIQNPMVRYRLPPPARSAIRLDENATDLIDSPYTTRRKPLGHSKTSTVEINDLLRSAKCV